MPVFDSNLSSIISAASPISKAILFILLLFSVVSWAIIFQKVALFRRVGRENAAFLAIFPKIGDAGELRKAALRHRESPAATVCLAGLERLGKDAAEPGLDNGGQGFEAHRFQILSRTLQRGVEEETARLASDLSFLATCGNVAPFVGLLGTVIGIINAFHEIGRQGSASIAAVAPGVAEALVATAAGLFVAIPAVMAYNYFLTRIRKLSGLMERFADDFMIQNEERAGRVQPAREVRS